MRLINKIILCVCLIGIFLSCGRNEETYLGDLRQNIFGLDSLRQYIEIHHRTEINDSLRMRLVFVNSRVKKPRYKGDIYDDEVILQMKKLKIEEIRFEGIDGKSFNKIYFEKDKFFYYPVVSYLYEYDGTTRDFESKTICYKPVNKHWSLYIDSNYP